MDPFDELLAKYRDRLGFLNGKGWDGCTCGCHAPGSGMVHIQACCRPNTAEIEELKRVFLDDPEARALLTNCIDHTVRNFSLNDLGGLFGGLGGFRRF